jgi:hypothetical protein
MAFTPFNDKQTFLVYDTSDSYLNIGSFVVTSNQWLRHIQTNIFIKGTLGGSETMIFKIYSRQNSVTALYSSNTVSLSAIGSYTPSWFGNIFFDFDDKPLNKNITYYARIYIANYTRNSNTFYIGINLDWPFPVNTRAVSTPACMFSLLSMRELT